MIYAIIILLIIIGVLIYKLSQKQKIDKCELEKYNEELTRSKLALEMQKQALSDTAARETIVKTHLEECKKDLFQAQALYSDLTENRMKELNDVIEETRQHRMEQLQETFEEAKSKYDLQMKEYETQRQKQAEEIRDACIESQNQNLEECKRIKEETDNLRQQYEALLEPIKQYLKDRQEKLFYTIQLSDEFKDDIEFLLTTVAARVRHPDIISKLVWAEYVKPNLDNTFKRIEARAEPGIYKLTSLENGMSYIGKSTDVKKRIADHFKSSIGIKSIADQAVHHAILKEGFWNWSIEIITYADKEKLNELEKYYIEFFKTQEFGYNKNSGGGG